MTTAVLIETRRSAHSNILLQSLGGRSGLARCIHRAARLPGAGVILVTVPEGDAGDAIAAEATANGAVVARKGADGLARASTALRTVEASKVLALKADQPFFDPVIAIGVTGLLTDANADFACNTMPSGFPDGLDCAAFPAALLIEADAKARTPSQRADAVIWMKAHPGLVKANLNGPGGGMESLRWRLSSLADLVFAEAVFEALGERAAEAGAAELAALSLRRPDLTALNAGAVNARRLSGDRASLQSRPVRFPLAA
jgi:spore coat polysaccharide biosynthesis protein SpsF (cytidylyltransferase family)